jgi:SAM-dependent methyltransferase
LTARAEPSSPEHLRKVERGRHNGMSISVERDNSGIDIAIRRAPILDVFLCEQCDHCDWGFAAEIVKCNFCGSALPLREGILEYGRGSGSVSPVIEEWNTHYEGETASYSLRTDWWTVSSWKKHLFAPAVSHLPGKLVLDVGCGTAERVANLAPLQQHGYHYIGVDSSFDALKKAAGNMPGGFFILADLESMRLRPRTVDVVLCLGLLMYFEGHDRLLDKLLAALKPGGILLLHELVGRKAWGGLARALFPLPTGVFPNRNVYPVSEREVRSQLTSCGTILHLHRAGSPGRRLLARLLDGSVLEAARPSAAWCDALWCATLGRMFPAMGAAELQIVFRKDGPKN